MWVAILLVAPAFAYVNSLQNPFHYDDSHSIVDNLHIRYLENIPRFFSDPSFFSQDPENAMYRPILLTSYALNYAVGELSVGGYHAVQLALHLACVVCVFAIAIHLGATVATAGAGALAFALHPIGTESVNYISSRSELLATFFMLAAFWFFLRHRSGGGAAPIVLCYGAAVLSKSVAIVFPVVLLAYDLIFDRIISWRRLKLYGVFGLVSAFYLGMVATMVEKAFVDAPVRSLEEQVWTQAKAVIFYLKLLWIPHGQSVDHQFLISDSLREPLVALAVGVMLSLVAVVSRVSEKCGLSVFFMCWLALSLAPTSIVPLNVLVNEHRLYMPAAVLAMGAALLFTGAGVGAHRSEYRQVAIYVLFLCACGVLAVSTIRRNAVWKSASSLWADAAAKAPLMARPHIYLGEEAEKRGDASAAMAAFSTVLNRDPYYAPAYLKIKDHIVESSGDLARATALMEAAVKRNLQSAPLWGGLGEAYRLQAQAAEAIGQMSEGRSWYAKSMEAYRAGVSFDDRDPALLNNLGNTLQALGNPQQAIQLHRQACALDEKDARSWLNLGNAQIMSGFSIGAVKSYRRAVTADPQFRQAWVSLAAAMERIGDIEGAAAARRGEILPGTVSE